jgi:hypothetical protein
MRFDGEQYGGYWFPEGNRIVLASTSVYRADMVRHEMLHSLLNDGSHQRVEFVDRCGGIVAFGDPLRIEPSELLPAPGPTSVVLTPRDLQVSIQVAPQSVSLGLPDSGWVTVIVTTTNPSSEPVWVRARPFHADQSAGQTFGYVAGTAHYGPTSFEDYSVDTLVAFGPGETKRRAFDFHLPNSAGDWWVRGYFNVDTTAAIPFTLSP